MIYDKNGENMMKNGIILTNIRQSRCDKMMDKFLLIDKHERIPLDVTLHLLRCKKCRTQVRYLTKAEKFASAPLKINVPVTDSKIKEILRQSNFAIKIENNKIKPVSMKKWIFCGILMIFLMLSYTFYAAKMGNEAAIAFFYIIFGIVVTAYCAIFIAANLDFVIKKIDNITHARTASKI